MREDGYNLGGEQSGHIVCLDHTTTGDGTITALMVLTAMGMAGEPLSQLGSLYETYPQTLINLPVREKRELMSIDAIATAITQAEQRLGERGRVLVRYSGTEAVARVMVEGEDGEAVETHARSIAAAVEAHLGL